MEKFDKKKAEDLIWNFSLLNGSKFDAVNPGSVFSAIIGAHPDWKAHMKDIQPLAQAIIKEVNKMSKDERLEELKDRAPELLEEKKVEKREGLKDLPNVGKNVVLRFAPSPSGPLHIGHSYVCGLNYQYKTQYKGKMILRIEDTNADNIDPNAYQMIPEDAQWLTDKGIDEVIVQSDRMELYYTYAIRLLDEGFAYICTCKSEVFKEKLDKMTPCQCRDLPTKEHLKRWHKMFSDYDEGDAVMRFKSDIKHPNPAMRDFPLIRINTSEHPRQGLKYRVWPLMNFAVAIDDMDLGITHGLRAKDHTDNAKRQAMMHDALKVKTPEGIFVGRINFEGFDLSTTQTKESIKQQKYTGWDDIRLPFLRAMKRKGYQPGALRKFAISMGVSLTDKTVSQEEFLKTLNAFNKEIIDPIAHRYFAIIDPAVITIKDAPHLEFEQDLHPDNKKGGRKFKTYENFYIEKDDLKNIKDGELIRLMGCLNFTKKGKTFEYVSKEYGAFRGNGTKQIHWLPQDQKQLAEIKIMLDDGTVKDAYAEKNVENTKKDQIVQFERFGFCRCDTKHSFWFTHR
jgi:glutamyl-tRNA synthetase